MTLVYCIKNSLMHIKSKVSKLNESESKKLHGSKVNSKIGNLFLKNFALIQTLYTMYL